MDRQPVNETEQPDGAGWSREAVTFRLTPKRKRALLAALGEDRARASPTGALDRAIEIALSIREREARPIDALVGDEFVDRLEALRAETHALSASTEKWEGINELLARVAAECAGLRQAIASSSILTDGVPVPQDSEIAPIKSWLDQLGSDVAWAVFRARWIGKRPEADGLASWDVELRMLRSSDHVPAPAVFAKLGPDRPDGPWAAMEPLPECLLSCERSEGAWRLALRPLLSQGKLGAPFAQWCV